MSDTTDQTHFGEASQLNPVYWTDGRLVLSFFFGNGKTLNRVHLFNVVGYVKSTIIKSVIMRAMSKMKNH